jgi:hypothetical protein
MKMTTVMGLPMARSAWDKLRDDRLRAGLPVSGIRPSEIEALRLKMVADTDDQLRKDCAMVCASALEIRRKTIGR